MGAVEFKSRRPDWVKTKPHAALQRGTLSLHCTTPLHVHQAVRRRSVPRRRSASTRARALLTSPPATRLAERAPVGYINPTICPLERCTMVANDAPHWFPDHREGERRLLPSRRSGLDRRYQSMAPPVERRGAGERRVLDDRRTWTDRRQHLTAE